MKIDITFLRSKVARRIFILFVCCALIPIAILAFLSIGHVTRQLSEQGQRRLHQMSKDIGMYIYERLLFLEVRMRLIASNMTANNRSGIRASLDDAHLKQQFEGIVLITNAGTSIPLMGHIQDIPALTPVEKQHLWVGETLVSATHHSSPRVFMAVALDPKHPQKGVLWGEINTAYLWGLNTENPWLPTAEICVLDHESTFLFTTLRASVSFPQQAMLQMAHDASGEFEWAYEDEQYIAGYWSIFLQARYGTPKWTVVLSETKADILAPLTAFKKTFLLAVLLSFWVAILLSIIQIRRSLIPLEQLHEGTKRIAMKDFRKRVTIISGDEFEELAASFNMMADRLDKQFRILSAIGELDRAILSTLNVEKIIDIILTRFHIVLPYDGVSITLLDSKDDTTGITYIKTGRSDKKRRVARITLTPEDIQRLSDINEFIATGPDEMFSFLLTPLMKRGMRSFVVMPLFLKQRLVGVITLWYRKPPEHSQDDLTQARQLADQVSVALSNARLVEELSELNWGALTTLARAIDAKSPWTAGHSERVTTLAVKIGEALGLTQEGLEILHRGGLLHDIGKIGVPADILDKTGKLSMEEERLMREHVRLGVRILEPMTAYADVMPLVLQHHECFDGTGYPDGIAGDAISLSARIFAVADYFDALTSHRPYRFAISHESAIESIKQGSGTKFDPMVVQAFMEVIARETVED